MARSPSDTENYEARRREFQRREQLRDRTLIAAAALGSAGVLLLAAVALGAL